MAYVEVYNAIWDNFGGTEHEIKLLQEGGSNVGQINILQRTPYQRSVRGGKKAQIKNQVFGSEIKFNFVVESADVAAFDAILESNYKEWKIEHYYDSVLDWVGWLQPDNFSREYVKNGDYYFFSYSGVDGLGNLKDIEFTNFSDGSQYTDRVTIMTTLKRALEHIGLELDFRVQLGTWCTNDSLMTSTECALDKATHDSRRFQKSKDGRLTNTDIYEVLSELLEPFNCYLIQSQAQYWIINTREDDSFYFPIPWSTLTVGSRTASDLKIDITGNEDFDNRGNFQKIRPLETVGSTFRDRNVRDNSLTNGDFHLANTDEWVEGTGFETFTTSAWEDNFELATAIVIAAGEPSEPPNFHSVAQTIVSRGEDDQIQVQFKVRCASLIMDAGFSGESFEAFVKVSCQIRKGTASGDIINPGGGAIMLSTANSEYRLYKFYMDIPEGTDDYFIEILIDKIESAEWSDYDTIDIRFDDFDIIAAYSTGEDITFDKYHKVSNADSSFIDFLDIDLKFGDSASDTDIGAFKIGGTRTETWSRFGKSENTSINFLAAKNIIENFSKYKDYIRLTIIDDTDRILPHSILQINSSNYQIVSQRAIHPGGLRKELKVELIEVLNAAVNVTIQEVGLSTSDGDGGSNSPFSDAVTNPSTNPSQPALTPNLQQVTTYGNLATNNIGITSANGSYFDGGGNVGIGTASPTKKLHVSGTSDEILVGLGDDSLANPYLFMQSINSSNRFAIYTRSNDQLSFGANNATDHIVIGTTGNVGIGITSPGYPVHVFKDVADAHLARFEGATPDYVDIFDYGVEINRSTGIIRNTLNGGSLIIGTNDGSDRTRISIAGGSNEIQFHTTGGQAMFSMDTASSDPRFVFKDSSGAASTLLYEDPTNLGGSVGSLVIDGGITGGFEGLSIGGRAAFIHNNIGVTGIYDDVNDQWIFRASHGSLSEMYNNGIAKIQAVSSGANIIGLLQLTQADASGSPPILISQNDVSEEMMEFSTVIGVGNAIEAVGVKSLTTTHFIKVTLPGSLTRYIPCGTIA